RLGVDDTAAAFLADRYRLPQPRLAIGQALLGIAHAMMDVSDGLVQDLGHLAKASGLAAIIEAASLRPSAAATIMSCCSPRRRQRPRRSPCWRASTPSPSPPSGAWSRAAACASSTATACPW